MRTLKNTTILQLLILFAALVWFFITISDGQRNRQKPDYIPIPNGNMILRMRLPIPPSPQQEIIIYNDGNVSQGTIEEIYSGKSHLHYQLSGEILDGIQDLQDDWCKRAPEIRMQTQDTPMYAIGLYCKGRNDVQVRIPTEQLPKELAPLLLQIYPYP